MRTFVVAHRPHGRAARLLRRRSRRLQGSAPPLAGISAGIRSADPAREQTWARLGSNQQPLVCETSALPLSYSPRAPIRVLDTPQLRRRSRRLQGSAPPQAGIRAAGIRSADSCSRTKPLTRPAETERCFPSHSPTLRPWIAGHRLRVLVIAVLRGGALEPEPRTRSEKSQAKAVASFQRVFRRRAEVSFSLRRGLNSELCLLQAGHHLWFDIERSPHETTKATRWVALDWLGCG